MAALDNNVHLKNALKQLDQARRAPQAWNTDGSPRNDRALLIDAAQLR